MLLFLLNCFFKDKQRAQPGVLSKKIHFANHPIQTYLSNPTREAIADASFSQDIGFFIKNLEYNL